MIRIAICDQDIHALESLYLSIHSYALDHSDTEFFLRRFQSAYDLLECVENPALAFQVYLINIAMPIYSGGELSRIIRERDEDATIIFTANSAECALETSPTAPLQFLLKPVAREKLYSLLDAACQKLAQSTNKSVLIKRKEGLSNVAIHQIEYVAYRDHALTIHLTDGNVITSRVIRKSFTGIIKESFSDLRFIRPHESYIINMDEVRGINGYAFQLASGIAVPISRRVFTMVKRSFIQYVAHRDGVKVLGT